MKTNTNQQEEKRAIENTLRLAVEIFRSCNSEYRVLGSTLIAAHTGRVFRHIGDLDVLLDKTSEHCVLEKLRRHGFAIEKRKKMGFQWMEATKKGYLGFTFLLVGQFTKDSFRWKFLKFCTLRMKTKYLAATQYNFGEVSFVGIPIPSVIAGIRQSFLNPKRKIDKKIMSVEMQKTNASTYGNIQVYILGIKIPFLYDLFSFFYNVYGGLRVLFGKKYEVWD